MIADASRGNSARLGRECIVTGEWLLDLPDSDISEVNCDTGAWFLGLPVSDIVLCTGEWFLGLPDSDIDCDTGEWFLGLPVSDIVL